MATFIINKFPYKASNVTSAPNLSLPKVFTTDPKISQYALLQTSNPFESIKPKAANSYTIKYQ